MTAGVAAPLRKATQKTRVEVHMATLKKYLYDEGPQSCDTLSDVIGLAESRTLEILGLMKHAGEVDIVRHGDSVYWMYAEDQHATLEPA